MAIGQIMQSLTNAGLYLAYAAGFALGNYVGIYLEEKIAMGLICVRTIANEDATELIDYLKEKEFGASSSRDGIIHPYSRHYHRYLRLHHPHPHLFQGHKEWFHPW